MRDSYDEFIARGVRKIDNIKFAQEMFKTYLGVNLPDTYPSLLTEGKEVDKNDLKSGDLIFFDKNDSKDSLVGIYCGRNSFVYVGTWGLRSSTLKNEHWAKKYSTARRYA